MSTTTLRERLPSVRYDDLNRFLFYAVTLLSLFVLLIPIIWMAITALRIDVYSSTILPAAVTLENVLAILSNSDFIIFYANSLFIATSVVILTVVLSTLGGYGLARVDIPLKETFARTILLGYMFPPILLAIPMFIYWRQIGLINSYLGVILAETALTLPFSLWLMWKFFQNVPASLEESARMAGAPRFRTFYDIALPMAKPGMIAVAVFAYAGSWDQYTIPKILLTDLQKWPLTVGVFSLIQQYSVPWGEVMAASAMIVIPSFLFVYSLQKYILQGFRLR